MGALPKDKIPPNVELPAEQMLRNKNGKPYKYHRYCEQCGTLFGTFLLMQRRCPVCCKTKPKYTKKCKHCGREFTTNSLMTRYCPECLRLLRRSVPQNPDELRFSKKHLDVPYEYVMRDGSRIKTTIREINFAAGLLVGKSLSKAANDAGLSIKKAEIAFNKPDFHRLMNDIAGDYTVLLQNTVNNILAAQLREIQESLDSGRLKPTTRGEARQWIALVVDFLRRNQPTEGISREDRNYLTQLYNRGVSDEDSPIDPNANPDDLADMSPEEMTD